VKNSIIKGLSWRWLHGSWVYNYLCNQCRSPLILWVRTSIRARCTTLCDQVCQWLATGRWFSPGPTVSSTNKTDRHDITEIVWKVALSTINQQFFRVSDTIPIFCRYIFAFDYTFIINMIYIQLCKCFEDNQTVYIHIRKKNLKELSPLSKLGKVYYW